MKILLYSLNFHPEVIGVGKYSGEMAQTLSNFGNQVRVIASQPYYPFSKVFPDYKTHHYTVEDTYKKSSDGSHEKIEKLKIYRCPIWVPKKNSGVLRIFMMISFAISSIPILIINCFWKPDLIIVVEPALICAPSSLLIAFITRAKSWLHIQDLEIDAAFRLGILKGILFYKLLKSIESLIIRKFSAISTISDEMIRTISYSQVKHSKIILMPNWVNLDLIKPSLNRYNTLNQIKKKLNIPYEYFVALYSGNMGNKQGLEILNETAVLAKNEKIFFIFCGEGSGKLELMQKTRELDNVRFIPLQNEKNFCDLISAVDVHLLPQRPDVSNYVLPSKLTGMLASGRPIVATATKGSELERIVSICGIVTKPHVSGDFFKAICKLRDDKQLSDAFGKAARSYAEKHLNRELIIKAAYSQMKFLTGK